MSQNFDAAKAKNEAYLANVRRFCLHLVAGSKWIPVTVMDSDYAVTTFHYSPEEYRQLGLGVSLINDNDDTYMASVHAVSEISDYIVFKAEQPFQHFPYLHAANPLDRFVAFGLPFGEPKWSVRVGNITGYSAQNPAFLYGEGNEMDGFSSGGVFYSTTTGFIGIVSGGHYGQQMLQIISARMIKQNIEMFGGHRFSSTIAGGLQVQNLCMEQSEFDDTDGFQ